jgi:hypothetical protein
MCSRIIGAVALFLAVQQGVIAQDAAMTPLRPDQVKFHDLYKELVETNTTLSQGSYTLAAERMAAHLKSAGYGDADITLFTVPDHPKEGGLVAVLAGTADKLKPISPQQGPTQFFRRRPRDVEPARYHSRPREAV